MAGEEEAQFLEEANGGREVRFPPRDVWPVGSFSRLSLSPAESVFAPCERKPTNSYLFCG